MKIEIEIASQRIADRMVTAIEGGSNYWCSGVYLKGAWEPLKGQLERPWYSDPKLYEGEFTIEIHEVSDEGEPSETTPHRVNAADVAAGFKLMAEKHGSHFGDFLADNEDATTADVWLQCVTLRDVIYG